MSDQTKTGKASQADTPAGSAQNGEGPAADDSGIKNPEGEAENPAPMPRADQGRGQPAKKPDDPEGQQGSTDHSRNR
jgi:hypothetical protein